MNEKSDSTTPESQSNTCLLYILWPIILKLDVFITPDLENIEHPVASVTIALYFPGWSWSIKKNPSLFILIYPPSENSIVFDEDVAVDVPVPDEVAVCWATDNLYHLIS